MNLEAEIISNYEKIKHQIQENVWFVDIQEAKRSNFEQFYLSMIKDNYGDPHFEIRKYLFKQELATLADNDKFEELTTKFSE